MIQIGNGFLIRLMQGALRAFGIDSCRAGQFWVFIPVRRWSGLQIRLHKQLGALRASGIDSNNTHQYHNKFMSG